MDGFPNIVIIIRSQTSYTLEDRRDHHGATITVLTLRLVNGLADGPGGGGDGCGDGGDSRGGDGGCGKVSF